MTINNRTKGANGEKIAVNYLIQNGYKIVCTNYHYSKFAEIDIIALKNETLVFIEVKARSTLKYGHPLESINRAKLERLYMAIMDYMEIHSSMKYSKFQLDVISIIGFQNPKIEHIENVSLD